MFVFFIVNNCHRIHHRFSSLSLHVLIKFGASTFTVLSVIALLLRLLNNSQFLIPITHTKRELNS